MSEDQIEMIYELITGDWDTERFPVLEATVVKDELAEGGLCSALYDQVYRAKNRLYERLDSDDDRDVDIIVSGLTEIGKHLAMKMFDYGYRWETLRQTIRERAADLD